MPYPQNPEATRRFEKAKKYLRLFLRDTPQLNRLITGYESDDEMLTFALDMTIDDWNVTTPVIGNTNIGNFPSLSLLMQGAVIYVLKSQGIYQARNELNYQSGGSSFVRANKSNYYQSWMINLANEYELKKRNLKMQQNISNGWGGVASEYDKIGFSW
jgi:hypothetical protein